MWPRGFRARSRARSKCVRFVSSPTSRTVSADRVRERIDEIYRSDSRRVLATLIRLLGDFDRAEEAMQDAFTAALEAWTADGVPANPRAWLVSTGRFKAIDRLRRSVRFDAAVAAMANDIEAT